MFARDEKFLVGQLLCLAGTSFHTRLTFHILGKTTRLYAPKIYFSSPCVYIHFYRENSSCRRSLSSKSHSDVPIHICSQQTPRHNAIMRIWRQSCLSCKQILSSFDHRMKTSGKIIENDFLLSRARGEAKLWSLLLKLFCLMNFIFPQNSIFPQDPSVEPLLSSLFGARGSPTSHHNISHVLCLQVLGPHTSLYTDRWSLWTGKLEGSKG